MFERFLAEASALITVWFLVRVQAGPPTIATIRRRALAWLRAGANETANETISLGRFLPPLPRPECAKWWAVR